MREELMNHIHDLFGLSKESMSQQILVYCSDYTLPASSHIEMIEHKINSPLPYKDFQFEYAISCYPFFKEEKNSADILMQLKELIRVAKEVRLAPYQLESEQVTNNFGPIILALQQESIGVEVTPLSPPFEHAVRIKLWAHECKLA